TTILGDGHVALVLGAEGIARHAGVTDYAVVEALPVPLNDVRVEEPMLLFRCGTEDLLASRVSSIRRVIAIDAGRIERVGGREMATVEGAAVNIIRLEQFLKVSPCIQKSSLFLLLPRAANSAAGLLISQIVDSRMLSLDAVSRTHGAEGVSGTIV